MMTIKVVVLLSLAVTVSGTQYNTPAPNYYNIKTKTNTKRLLQVVPPEVVPPGSAGYCQDDEDTRDPVSVPKLNLLEGSDVPNIDGKIDLNNDTLFDSVMGWNGTEYENFAPYDLFTGGKSEDGDEFLTGTAYMAYDCANDVICVAAHLNGEVESDFLNNKACEGDDSFTSFGGDGGDEVKFSNSSESKIAFEYIRTPEGVTIGWEGCWNTTLPSQGNNKVALIFNNIMEIHFNSESVEEPNCGETTSSGKAQSPHLCFDGNCTSLTPTASPTSSPTVSPTASPTTSPTVSPTGSPTASPTSSPTVSPTASPTTSPTVSPTGSPTASPTSSPTVSPTASPTTSPTMSPTGSPTASPPPTPPPTKCCDEGSTPVIVNVNCQSDSHSGSWSGDDSRGYQ